MTDPAVELHSAGITEDGAEVSIWLIASDRSIIACYLRVSELLARGSVIEQAPADDAGLAAQTAAQAAKLALQRIRLDSIRR